MNKKRHEYQDFDGLLLEAIDEGLSSISLALRDKVYFFLERDFGIKKDQIPSRLEEFSSAIRVMLGSGAMPLELLFMKQFHKKVKSTYKWAGPKWLIPDLTFQTYIEMKTTEFEKKNKEELGFWVDFDVNKKRIIVKTQKSKRR